MPNPHPPSPHNPAAPIADRLRASVLAFLDAIAEQGLASDPEIRRRLEGLLAGQAPATAAIGPVTVSRDEAAALLGCSVDTVDRLIGTGALRAVRFSRKVRISRQEIDRFIRAGGSRDTGMSKGGSKAGPKASRSKGATRGGVDSRSALDEELDAVVERARADRRAAARAENQRRNSRGTAGR